MNFLITSILAGFFMWVAHIVIRDAVAAGIKKAKDDV